MRLCSIVAATDLGQDADRALPWAADLARRASVPIEVLTVVADGELDQLEARLQQEQLVERHRLGRCTLYIEHDLDVARSVAAHVTDRDGALLVMATTGRRVLGEQQLGAVTEGVLRAVRQPVLVLGPRCTERPARRCSPVALVDGSQVADALLTPIEAWALAFSAKEPLVVEVIPPTSWPSADDASIGHVDGPVEQLRKRGLAARGQIIRAGDPADALVELVDQLDDAVLVLPSPRWEGDPTHWFSTVRRLIRSAASPVLVVPTDLAA